jgi:hypothetical protein
VTKTRQNKNLEPRFDSIETEKALAAVLRGYWGLRFGMLGLSIGRPPGRAAARVEQPEIPVMEKK